MSLHTSKMINEKQKTWKKLFIKQIPPLQLRTKA